ncbi:hypothetical protein B0T14DRAFT_570149 [Immersiella caudata]|uniref:Indoleamine 2,3-dioxygenase n=1 Tax=Immersiella caudata TaxID=314043 RepID=A0AA39WF14_9PEZI|nr:hypothetical protein B0T14DRAFT_570149 [Immersiella caudata]
MGSLDVAAPFQVLDDHRPEDMSLPAFMVSTKRGFLPRMDPIVTLPSDFDVVESILQRMPVKTADGTPGLLANGKLGDVIDAELPDLTDAIDKYKANLPLMNALYRDYSFLASAYLLEPCHQRFLRGESYGLGRQVLPANLARPIARCADLCEFKPFMEYAGSYALFNYRLLDPSLPPTPSNLTLIRAFEHGLDPSSSEAGFVLVHIDMALNSGPLVASTLDILSSVSSSSRPKFNTAMTDLVTTLEKINAAMETMWNRSRPTQYTSFRTFIFGITAQSMFPDGVIYEGVGPDPSKPLSFRGESGANDSMIPLVDNLVGVPMPDTPLTEILLDFRKYRPSNHREFLGWVKERAEGLGVKRWALGLDASGSEEGEGMRESRGLWLKVLNQVRDFRWRHWCFAREYILKRTSHPTATGGSPIVTWLPNQLRAVLDEMVRLHEDFGGDEGGLGEDVKDVMDLVKRQQGMLRKEVRKFCEERGVAARTV